ncbi:MAG TPA: polyprenol phosphomannose-dependent alpha 1,6 mannosyltransferase MptB [Acidimicrobiales bacterium]|nr:polyprenol phosphomannose-dependent alpha 1,6 mannosyltransferase MptB [Acidimicrobiales bacterium]
MLAATAQRLSARDAARWRPSWRRIGWPWTVVGLAGTTLVAVVAPAIVGGSAGWWWSVRVPPGTTGNRVALYVGVAAVAVAWLAVGRSARLPATRPVDLVALALFWSLPLVVAPPLFSQDVYSYLAQGAILHAGLDPYRVAPDVLAHLGGARLAAAVSPFWRTTISPYGPSFVGAMSLVSVAARSSLELGVVLARLVELAGLLLAGIAVPAIARTAGGDPTRAVWLGVASPLVLFELVGAGHNDALMVGLMALGVAAALRHHPLVAVGIGALAASVKAPAAVAVVFVVVCSMKSASGWPARLRVLAESAAVACAAVAAVVAAAGLGTAWISSSVLSAPAQVHLAITPVSELAWIGRAILGAVGPAVSLHSVVVPVGDALFALGGLVALVLVGRARLDTMVVAAGVSLLVVAFLGPAAWPWYFTWGLVLVAGSPSFQRSRVLVAALIVGVVLVKPDGILVFPFGAAPYVLGAYVVGGLAAWRVHRRRGQGRAAGDLGAAELA